MRRATQIAVVAMLLAGPTACAREAGGPTPTPAPTIVASTDVWGSIAEAVAGGDARVTSVISGTLDPHSFGPAPTAVAAIEDAALVVYNGGGYDAWVDEILANRPAVAAVDAYSLLDRAAVGEGQPANEHVFYELNTAKAVANRIAERLAAADPAHASQYRSRAAEFSRGANSTLEREHAMRTAFPGAAVVATEPVAHYLLLAAGLTDKTPVGLTNAVEQDTDPAPADIAEMLDLLSTHQVAALILNDQTMTGATRQIRDAAERAGVPTVEVTETLPTGEDYLSWQADTVDRLTAALQKER